MWLYLRNAKSFALLIVLTNRLFMNLLMPNNYIISDFLQVLLVVLILVVIVDRYFLSLDQLLFLDLSRVLIDNFFELFP